MSDLGHVFRFSSLANYLMAGGAGDVCLGDHHFKFKLHGHTHIFTFPGYTLDEAMRIFRERMLEEIVAKIA